MANVTIAAADVAIASPLGDGQYVAGEDIDAGEEFYVADDGLAYLASCDVDDDSADAAGTAVGTGLEGQAFPYKRSGSITIGTHGVAIGTLLFTSATPGKICPEADLVSTNRIRLVGIIDSATTMYRHWWNTGVAVP